MAVFSSGKSHSGDLPLPAKTTLAVLVIAVVAASALAYVSAEDGDSTRRYATWPTASSDTNCTTSAC